MFVKDTAITITWTIDKDQAFVAATDYDLLVQEPDGVSTYNEGAAWQLSFTAPNGTDAGIITDTQTPDKAGVWTYVLSNGSGASYTVLSTALIMVVDTDITHAISVSA